MKYILRFGFLGLLVFMLILSGCSVPINVYLRGANNLNPDEQNRALPVQVRIYQLKDKNAFMQATFRQLWQQDSATLGSSMLDKRVVTVDPGKTVKTVLSRNKQCRYVGVVAVFRRLQGESWRVIKKVKVGVPGIALTATVNIVGNSVEFYSR